jgi:hypothetical protein
MAPSSERDAEARATWRSAVIIATLAAVAPLYSYLNFPSIHLPLRIARVATLAWEAGLIAILLLQRAKPRLEVARVVFGLAAVPLLPMFVLIAKERTIRGLPLELFIRENLTSLIFAVASPPSATICLAVIAACTGQAFLSYWLGGYPISTETLQLEPWTTVLYGILAVALALFRSHRQRREVRLIVENERAGALRRMVRSYLAVRDFVNTPLQTLRAGVSLLAARHPEERALTDSLERSVDRLRELNQVLATDSTTVELRAGEESFDPIAVLRPSTR